MEQVKGTPYFCSNVNKIKQYPYIDNYKTCDILIIGGGIDGAIANYYLSKNHDVILVDENRFGMQCTSCATALLEYQLDDFAEDLSGELSDYQVATIYRKGLYSIEKIKNLIDILGNHCNFQIKDTLVYSTKNKDIEAFENEYEFRKKYGFDVRLFTSENNPFPFKDFKIGLYCDKGGAELNPYLFTKMLIENSVNQNQMYENTKIERLENFDNKIIATTNYGEKITAKKVIACTGFNYDLFTSAELCEKFVSYTIVTKPIKDIKWKENALIQDYMKPYHYMRILPDNRIIFGGNDTPYKNIIKENQTNKIYEKLLKDLKNILPYYSNKIEVEYNFCGLFGSTDNNLGMIGYSDNPNVLYFLSCGANGIINAMFGIEIIEDILNNKPNELAEIFSANRLKKD